MLFQSLPVSDGSIAFIGLCVYVSERERWSLKCRVHTKSPHAKSLECFLVLVDYD